MTLEQENPASEEETREIPTTERAPERGEAENLLQENPAEERTRESAPCFPRGVIKRGKGGIRLLGIKKKQKTAPDGAEE